MLLPDVVTIDKDVMRGTPVFKGTRVPLKNLVDYLEGYNGGPIGRGQGLKLKQDINDSTSAQRRFIPMLIRKKK
jgi:hypothetical protein